MRYLFTGSLYRNICSYSNRELSHSLQSPSSRNKLIADHVNTINSYSLLLAAEIDVSELQQEQEGFQSKPHADRDQYTK